MCVCLYLSIFVQMADPDKDQHIATDFTFDFRVPRDNPDMTASKENL